jgi:hypothetical protein
MTSRLADSFANRLTHGLRNLSIVMNSFTLSGAIIVPVEKCGGGVKLESTLCLGNKNVTHDRWTFLTQIKRIYTTKMNRMKWSLLLFSRDAILTNHVTSCNAEV